jgi:O-acetyl-ADP-ribose deacetylase (regulator of RNase III)
MIEYIEGDIFNSPAQVIVNTVNTVGVMGKGLALSFKNRYPEMFQSYKLACDKNLMKIGKLMLFYSPDHWILLFPTKENWRYPSKLEYIEEGLSKFVRTFAEKNITSIAFPRLGCGNGELNWEDVRPIMEKYLRQLPIDIYIYTGTGPDPIPEHKAQKETMEWLRGNAKDMSFKGVLDDIKIQTALLPLAFSLNNDEISVKYLNGLEFNIKDQKQTLSEDDFFQLWDEIRKCGIFSADGPTTKALTYGALLKLGYLSKIRIQDNKTGNMRNGYQLNEGLGRAYGLKEVLE